MLVADNLPSRSGWGFGRQPSAGLSLSIARGPRGRDSPVHRHRSAETSQPYQKYLNRVIKSCWIFLHNL